MEEAFKDADIVYPKSWAPFAAMEERTDLYAKGDQKELMNLNKDFLNKTKNTWIGLVQKK